MNKIIKFIFLLVSVLILLFIYRNLSGHFRDSSYKPFLLDVGQNVNSENKNILWYDGKRICGTSYEMRPRDESPRDSLKDNASIESIIATKKNQLHLKGLAEVSGLVELHGRVLDQDDHGIPDVCVMLSTSPVVRLQDGNLSNPELIFEVYTNAQGDFSVSGFRSVDIAVADLKKEGYKPSLGSKGQYHITQLGAWGSEQSPIIFRMWRSHGAEPLIVGQSAFQVLSSEGTALTIDKITGYVKTIKNPISIYLMRDDSTLEKGGEGAYVYDWSFKVEVPEGGVVLTDAEQAFYAPADGYQPTASYSVIKNSADWSSQKKLTVYLTSGSPPKYSRLEFEINSNNGFALGGLVKEGVINWQVFTNPSGSRNLEYDPAKRIKPDNNK